MPWQPNLSPLADARPVVEIKHPLRHEGVEPRAKMFGESAEVESFLGEEVAHRWEFLDIIAQCPCGFGSRSNPFQSSLHLQSFDFPPVVAVAKDGPRAASGSHGGDDVTAARAGEEIKPPFPVNVVNRRGPGPRVGGGQYESPSGFDQSVGKIGGCCFHIHQSTPFARPDEMRGGFADSVSLENRQCRALQDGRIPLCRRRHALSHGRRFNCRRPSMFMIREILGANGGVESAIATSSTRRARSSWEMPK